jgi:hypothetical protein
MGRDDDVRWPFRQLVYYGDANQERKIGTHNGEGEVSS